MGAAPAWRPDWGGYFTQPKGPDPMMVSVNRVDVLKLGSSIYAAVAYALAYVRSRRIRTRTERLGSRLILISLKLYWVGSIDEEHMRTKYMLL